MAQTKNLGKVSVTPRGTYTAGTSYERLDIVTYQGGSWIALQNSTNVTPAAGAYWQQLSSKGDKGDQGPIGDTVTVDGVAAQNGNIPLNAVVYDSVMSLTSTQKGNVRTSIGAGEPVTIDSALSDSSTNPVQNKVIDAALDSINATFDDYARIDGYYESLTSGNAEQLVSTVGVTDMVPYNFRTSGGSADIGDREVDEIVGGTVAWNQPNKDPIADNYGVASSASTDYATVNNGIITFLAKAQYGGVRQIVQTGSVIKGHKYFITFDIMLDSIPEYTPNNAQIYWPTNNITQTGIYVSDLTAGVWSRVTRIKEASGNYSHYQNLISDSRNSGWSEVHIKNYMHIDLTQALGSTIADYIYTLESGTAGAGVAWFRKLFPKPYYAYEAGKLESVNVSAHKTVGYNALDVTGRTEVSLANGNYPTLPNISDRIYYKGFKPDLTFRAGYVGNISLSEGNVSFTTNTTTGYGLGFPVKCLPNTTYYSHFETTTNCSVQPVFFDIDGNYISKTNSGVNNQQFTTPADCFYIVYSVTGNIVGSVGVTGVTISLYWDGERAGEYEAYNLHAYPLDSSLTLRGIPKLDANNELYYDGDVYASDGTVTRKYGIYTFSGSETWTQNSATSYYFTGINDLIKKPADNNSKIGLIIVGLETSTRNLISYGSVTGDYIAVSDVGGIYITAEVYSDLATKLTGKTLLYELATPTTESADPYQNPQIVDDWGTEEYVDYAESQGTRDVAIPVGHTTKYQSNLRAKLEMLPNSPSGNGDYLLRQSSGINTFVPYIPELPVSPGSDGTYSLKCTVSSGTATLSWVADS